MNHFYYSPHSYTQYSNGQPMGASPGNMAPSPYIDNQLLNAASTPAPFGSPSFTTSATPLPFESPAYSGPDTPGPFSPPSYSASRHSSVSSSDSSLCYSPNPALNLAMISAGATAGHQQMQLPTVPSGIVAPAILAATAPPTPPSSSNTPLCKPDLSTSSVNRAQFSTPPASVHRDENGIDWITFYYSKDRLLKQHTIRCDIESIDINMFTDEFKKQNCIYPRACVPREEYKGTRQKYETECNCIGWCLAYINPSIRQQRGLIQRSVDSWRNTNANPSLRSRRVRRMHRKAEKLRRASLAAATTTTTAIPQHQQMSIIATSPSYVLPTQGMAHHAYQSCATDAKKQRSSVPPGVHPSEISMDNSINAGFGPVPFPVASPLPIPNVAYSVPYVSPYYQPQPQPEVRQALPSLAYYNLDNVNNNRS